MAFIALKANSCSDVQDNKLAIKMNIFEEVCSESKAKN
jgi:hypothetical protein